MTDREYLDKWMPRIEAAIFRAYRREWLDGGLLRRAMNADAEACEKVLLEIRAEFIAAFIAEKQKSPAANVVPANKQPVAA
jgi:hypothetical protein